MDQLLFRVADVFSIRGRGVVVVSDVRTWPADFRLRVGEAIEVVRAGGSRFRTSVGGIEMMHMTDPTRRPLGVLLGPEVEKAGVEVWRVDAAGG